MATYVHPNGTIITTDSTLSGSTGPTDPSHREPEPEDAASTAEVIVDEDTQSRTVWVGNIPSNIVGQSGSAVLNINANKHISSLFAEFGVVSQSTVRVKAGATKSWALVTFANGASAARAVAEGMTVLDAEYEELDLRIEPFDMTGHLQKSDETSGYLALLAKTHSKTLAPDNEGTDTLWLGGIPAGLIAGDDEVANQVIRDLCAGFGEVLATTVRKKEGTNKSWSLVTFTSPDCVEEAMAAGVRATVEGAEVDLRVKPADIECELQKGTTGYLAHMASRHEKEVANAKSLMRGWWNRASTEAPFVIEKRFARYRPLSGSLARSRD